MLRYAHRNVTSAAFVISRVTYVFSTGLGNGALSTPSPSTDFQVKLPVDDREVEIASALVMGSVVALYLSMQALSVVNSDLHPWASLVGAAGVLFAGLDAVFRKGAALKLAVAGLERLTLRDEERDEFLEASG